VGCRVKSSDPLLELHDPLLAIASGANAFVLACYFRSLWLALIAGGLVAFFMRSAWRRVECLARHERTLLAGHHVRNVPLEQPRCSGLTTRSTTQGSTRWRTAAGHSHSLPFGLRLFVQPSDCDAGQHRGASVGLSPVAACGGRGTSSPGQHLVRHGRATAPPHAACHHVAEQQCDAIADGRVAQKQVEHEHGTEHNADVADVKNDGPEPSAEHGVEATRRTT